VGKPLDASNEALKDVLSALRREGLDPVRPRQPSLRLWTVDCVWPRKLNMVTPVDSAARSRTVGMEHGEKYRRDNGIDRMACDGK